MSSEARIPLVVSVTGHRQIRETDRESIENSVRATLEKLKKDLPTTPLKLMTNLAEGADTLCARIALELGIPLLAALPQPLEKYRACFAGAALTEFDELTARAELVFTVPDTEERPADATRRFDYRQGGLYLVTHSQLLLALWEGNTPKPGGCGTAEIVDCARSRRLPVIRISCPRDDSCDLPAGEVRELGDREELKRLERFNAEAEKLPPREEPGIFPRSYYAAAAISRRAAKKYRLSLRLTAILGTALALSLLLFDEMELAHMIFACGGLLLLLAAERRLTVRSRCQEDYLDCRVLAESLRVQACLRHAGSGISMSSLFTLYQRTVTGWITRTVPVLEIGADAGEKHDISELWLQSQLDYHLKTRKKNAGRSRRNSAVLRTVRTVSVLIYLTAAVLEYVYPVSWLRSAVCISLGFFAAASLFLSLYFGRLSVDRHSADSAMMAEFYQTMLDRMRADGQTEELLEECAREEILENANWYAYTSENAPDLSFL